MYSPVVSATANNLKEPGLSSGLTSIENNHTPYDSCVVLLVIATQG